MVGDTQCIRLPHFGLHPLDPWAVEHVIQGAIRAIHARVVGEVRQPLRTINPAGFTVTWDHRVFIPQQVQLTVRRIPAALAGVQAQELPQRQQVEIPADQPGCATAFEFIHQLHGGFHLLLYRRTPWHVAIQAGVEHRQLAAITQGEIGQQQGRFGLELAADEIGRGHGQL